MLPENIEFDPPEHKPAPFPFISARELTLKPIRIDWLLEGFLERESLNLLFGEPGAGKSLFALDWAFCIATGRDWHGYNTKQADVVIVAGEGFAGLSRRVKALEQKYKMLAPESLHISQRPAQLMDEKNAQWVADSINSLCANPGLIIIDTLHRNIEGDENSSQDIAKFISNLDNYLKPLGAAVLIVHHSGHGQKDRSRGSSSIRAAMDGEFSATKGEGGIVLSCHKAKDFEAFTPLQFSLKPTDLDWLDDDGEPMTSVYLEHVGEAKPIPKKRKLSARDDAILTALTEAIDKHGIVPSSEIKEKFGGFSGSGVDSRKVVNIDHWREQAYKAIVVDANTDDARRMAFKRCRDKLFDQGFTVEYDGYAWPIFDRPNNEQNRTKTNNHSGGA
ncbi:AAA family ATPase [Methylomonas sp. MK1]|uniref:AAA family ATPase n=1 Tax=Methylomonas sp. MK1 TaxID=1131552 RepID=UPI00037A8072